MELRGARYIHILVPCPLGWGSAPDDTIRLARLADGDRALPAVRGRGRRGHRPSRRSASRCRSTSTCKLQKRFAHLFGNAARHRARSRRSRRPPTATSRASACSATRRPPDGQAVRDHARRRLEPGQQDRLVAHRAARSTSTGCRRATTPARPARTSRAGSTTPRAATTRPPGARSTDGQSAARGHGPRLLPPLRDAPATAASSTRRSASTRSSASSATRRSSAAGSSSRRRTRVGKRVLVVGAGPVGPVGRLPPAPRRPRGRRSIEAGPLAGGMMRFGIPKYRLPRDVLDARGPAHPRPRRRRSSSTRKVDRHPRRR